MRVLVTGSVRWTDPVPIEEALDHYLSEHPAMILLTGMADGADALARRWANRNGVPVWAEPLTPGEYPAPMHRYNERMLAWDPNVVLAYKADLDVEGNPQAGTEHMCRIAASAGVRVLLVDARSRLIGKALQMGDEPSKR